jgi:hypothetical protein
MEQPKWDKSPPNLQQVSTCSIFLITLSLSWIICDPGAVENNADWPKFEAISWSRGATLLKNFN